MHQLAGGWLLAGAAGCSHHMLRAALGTLSLQMCCYCSCNEMLMHVHKLADSQALQPLHTGTYCNHSAATQQLACCLLPKGPCPALLLTSSSASKRSAR